MSRKVENLLGGNFQADSPHQRDFLIGTAPLRVSPANVIMAIFLPAYRAHSWLLDFSANLPRVSEAESFDTTIADMDPNKYPESRKIAVVAKLMVSTIP